MAGQGEGRRVVRRYTERYQHHQGILGHHRLSGKPAVFRICKNAHVLKQREQKIPALKHIIESSQLVYLSDPGHGRAL